MKQYNFTIPESAWEGTPFHYPVGRYVNVREFEGKKVIQLLVDMHMGPTVMNYIRVYDPLVVSQSWMRCTATHMDKTPGYDWKEWYEEK